MEDQYFLKVGNETLHLHDIEIILLYHSLAKQANQLYSTNYEWSQAVINKLYKKRGYRGSLVVSFQLEKHMSDNNVELEGISFYDNKTSYATTTRYGTFTPNEIIEMINELYPIVHSTYFYDVSKKVFEYLYEHQKYTLLGGQMPNYFDLLLWE